MASIAKPLGKDGAVTGQSEDEQPQSPPGASSKDIDLKSALIEIAALNEIAARLRPKTRWHRFREWAPIWGNIIALIGVGFAVWNSNVTLSQSIRASAETNQRSSFQAVISQEIGIDTTITNFPEVLPYFLQGIPVPANADPKLKNLVQQIAVQRVDMAEYMYYEVLSLGVAADNGRFVLRSSPDAATTNDDWLAWSEDITGNFRRSPAMCTAVRDIYSAYGEQFITALAETKICPDLKEFPPNRRGTS